MNVGSSHGLLGRSAGPTASRQAHRRSATSPAGTIGVTGPTARHDVRHTSLPAPCRQSVPPHPEGVLAVAVPVTDEHDVTGSAVLEHDVGVAAGHDVAHVVLVAAADREGVAAVAVPVT